MEILIVLIYLTMKVINKSKDIRELLARLETRSPGVDRSTEDSVRKILDEVKTRGDDAVLEYTRKFDHPGTRSLRVTPSEMNKSANMADLAVVRSLEKSAKRIRKFHERQTGRSWSFSETGAVLGQAIRPLGRVGVYVPGGKAAYPSTVLMNVIPAQVAGVKEIAVCVPFSGGRINPFVMAALRLLEIKEVYRIGGAQAIGAMAYGTKTVRRVDKIVGPGNIYVATAKKLVFGAVDIDMIAGPSEILIIADDSADASFVAADLLSQAEHDELASSILVTDSRDLALRVLEELEKQILSLSRKRIACASIDNFGAIIISKDLKAAIDLANRIAPEHLELMVAEPNMVLPLIENAGAIFLGQWTPEALGDYSAGPNHTLPTGGSARFFSPLGVYDFYKRSSILGFTRKAFLRISKTVEDLAECEGLDAHAGTIRVRRERIKKARALK